MRAKVTFPKIPLDNVVSIVIMKCLERDETKRVNVHELIKFIDNLELMHYGSHVSLNNFEKALQESRTCDELV